MPEDLREDEAVAEIIQGMLDDGVPLTRENYLEALGTADVPDEFSAEFEASLPERFQLLDENGNPNPLVHGEPSPRAKRDAARRAARPRAPKPAAE